MRATRAKGGTAGRSCESGWIDLERQSVPAAILELATWTGGASLHATAPVGAAQTAAFHHHPDLAHSTVRDPTVEARAAVGTDATLDAVADLRVLLHRTNL